MYEKTLCPKEDSMRKLFRASIVLVAIILFGMSCFAKMASAEGGYYTNALASTLNVENASYGDMLLRGVSLGIGLPIFRIV